MPRRLRAAGALALAVVSLAACATVDRSAPLAAFRQGRLADARAWHEARLVEEPDDQVLEHNEAGVVALAQGDLDAAYRHFLEGFTAMEDLSSTTGETIAALVGPERSKTWKGDPYERCMNAYYLGVTHWLKGDADNAAACFKAGVLRDADSEKGEAQSDFGLLWFLMGMAQRAALHEDRGAAALARARALLPSAPWLEEEALAKANLLVVVDLGLGPAKVATGPHGAVVRFRARPYAAAGAEVRANGTTLGRTTLAGDVMRQAVTRGDKVIDHVNQGKAVFKDVAIVAGVATMANSRSREGDLLGAGLFLAGLLAPAEADVRHWGNLPGEVHVLAAALPEGEHEIAVDVLDAAGVRLPLESKVMRVTVRAGRLAFAWVRALPVTRPGSRIEP